MAWYLESEQVDRLRAVVERLSGRKGGRTGHLNEDPRDHCLEALEKLTDRLEALEAKIIYVKGP